MARLFDVDALLGVHRIVRLGGEDFPVQELRLRDVLETQRIAKGIGEGDESTFAAMVSIVRVYVPLVPEEALRDLPLTILGRLHAFLAQKEDEEDTPPVAA